MTGLSERVTAIASPRSVSRKNQHGRPSLEFFKHWGAIGGRLGGRIRAEKLTPE